MSIHKNHVSSFAIVRSVVAFTYNIYQHLLDHGLHDLVETVGNTIIDIGTIVMVISSRVKLDRFRFPQSFSHAISHGCLHALDQCRSRDNEAVLNNIG